MNDQILTTILNFASNKNTNIGYMELIAKSSNYLKFLERSIINELDTFSKSGNHSNNSSDNSSDGIEPTDIDNDIDINNNTSSSDSSSGGSGSDSSSGSGNNKKNKQEFKPDTNYNRSKWEWTFPDIPYPAKLYNNHIPTQSEIYDYTADYMKKKMD